MDVYGLAGRQAKPLFWRHERLPFCPSPTYPTPDWLMR